MRRWNLILLTAEFLALTATLAMGQYLEATIPFNSGVSDMVWNPAANKVYVCNRYDNIVTVIDGATNQVTTVISVADEPADLCVSPTSNRIYCTSGESNYLNLIDAAGDTLIGKMRVRGYPMRMACNTLMNKLYVICSDDDMVRVYDGTAGSLLAEVWFGEWNIPYYLLWHPGTNRVFCVTRSGAQSDTVFAIDCQTDLVAARAPVGDQPDAICRNPVSGLVYVSSAHAVHVLSPTGDSVVAVVPLPLDHTTCMCAVPFPDKVYAKHFNSVYVIDGNSHAVTDSIAANPTCMVCDTDKAKVYIAERTAASVIDARGDSVLLTIPLTDAAILAVAWNSTNSRVYMMDYQNGVIYVIRDTSTAVAEPAVETQPASWLASTMSRGRLRLDGDGPAWLLDLTGRQVAVLNPGDNDLHRVRAGVYFVRSAKCALTRKVIIQN